jgi:hypothetical protein
MKRQHIFPWIARDIAMLLCVWPLAILMEKASRRAFYRGILHFKNTTIGWNGVCAIFYGHAVEILFCILYTLYAPYEGEQGFGALIMPRCQSLKPWTSCKDPVYCGMPGLGILAIFPTPYPPRVCLASRFCFGYIFPLFSAAVIASGDLYVAGPAFNG